MTMSSKRSPYGTEGAGDAEVLGVLTGQVPVPKSMPVTHSPSCNDLCREGDHHLCGPECGTGSE